MVSSFPSDASAYVVGIIVGLVIGSLVILGVYMLLNKQFGVGQLDEDAELDILRQEAQPDAVKEQQPQWKEVVNE